MPGRWNRGVRLFTTTPEPGWPEGRKFLPPVADSSSPEASPLSGLLTFQNRQEAIGFPPDWNRAGLPLLWLYHLHYHEFLWSMPFEGARDAVMDWIARYPRRSDRVGWEPYPTSARLTTWCTLFFGRHRDRTLADGRFRTGLWLSICEQADHLVRNLQCRPPGDNLLERAAALAVAGSCFDDATARGWLGAGSTMLARELPEQILDDGGHVERSPMHQCRVVYVLLLLHATGVPALQKLVRPHLDAAAYALATLTHPDGKIALFNDRAFGVHPGPERIARTAGATFPAPGVFALSASGYYGARTRDGHYVLCDAGSLGPDSRPGRGHPDLFSFELSLRGARVVVDSGVSTYAAGRMRDTCRSNPAHNTVEIEGGDQVEPEGAFQVGRRGRPRDIAWTTRGEAFELSARHEGYRVLPGQPARARRFRWRSSGVLEVGDRVDAAQVVRSVARLHFHPHCRLSGIDGAGCNVDFPGGRGRVGWSGWETVESTDSFYCPEFGIATRNPCLALTAAAQRFRGAIRIEAV